MIDKVIVKKIKIRKIYQIIIDDSSEIQLERSDIIRYNNAVREFKTEEAKFRKTLKEQIKKQNDRKLASY